MAALSERPSSFRAVVRRNGSTLVWASAFVTVVLVATLERSLPLAIYLLSFWHYVLYWLAFAFSAIAFDVFKRDAIALKTVSVTALALVYLGEPLDLVSLAVIAGGILLNI